MKVKLKFIIAVCLVMIAALSVILVRQYHKADTAHATDVTESNGAKIGFFQAGDGVYLHEEYWSSGIYYTYTYDSSSIFSAPQTEEHNWNGGDVFYYQFKNQYSVSPSTYIIFSNAVISTDGKTYDLLIRPFTCDSDARIIFYGRLNTGKEGYFLGGIAHGGRYGMQLFIVEHGTGTNENPNFVEMSTIMGIADLDYNEGLIIPMSSGFEPIHIGSSVLTAFSDDVDDAIFYYGKSSSDSEDDMYNTHCLFGKVKIPTSGLTIYYHGPGNVALMDFEALSSYGVIFNDEYGNGNVPAPILKSGEGGLGTVMGQAGSQVPAREGYMFKGWSVTKEYSSSNRILFASNTNSGTTFQDYCNLAGVDPNASKILNLYAQWEPVYEVHFNANGGSGNVPDTLSNFGDNMNVVMGATQTKVPTRTG